MNTLDATENFCCAPFSQLLLQPTGTVSPCCYLQGIKLGSSEAKSWDAVWNGKKLRSLRQEFLSGKPRTCKSRMWNQGCQHEFAHLKNLVKMQEVQDKPPLRLDLRLAGFCNLKCVMCEVWQQPSDQWFGRDLWLSAKDEIYPHLVEVEIAGGEPFVQAQTLKVVEDIYLVNPHCQFSFITNGQYPWSPRIANLLDKLMLKEIHVSIDSLNAENYARIRLGGTLEVVLENIKRFSILKQKKDFVLKCSMCVLQENWREISAFISFCVAHRVTPILQFAHFDQQGHSLKYLNLQELEEVQRSLLAEVSEAQHAVLLPVLKPLRSLLRKSQDVHST